MPLGVKVPSKSMTTGRLLLDEAMRRLASAASRGHTAVSLVEAEQLLAAIAHAPRARILLRTGGVWRTWEQLDEGSGSKGALQDLPSEALNWDRPHRLPMGLFVPIRVGAICALIQDAQTSSEEQVAIEALAAAIDLSLTTSERQRIASQNLDQVHVLQLVATRILKSHDLEEILLLITQETKRLLTADICGIMLRDGDEIVMRRCVGNHSIETSSLRMRQGQGLAGRVFATHEPCRVEDYLESGVISRDFSTLAQQEMVRSALGAPLLSRDDVIGVLEVWRRQPSIFTEQDTSRLVALANLTSIAIENARLHARQQSMVRELTDTNRALSERYEIIRHLAQFQKDLIQLLLDGSNLAAIAARVAQHLDNDVFFVDGELRIKAAHPPVNHLPEELQAALKSAQHDPTALSGKAVMVPSGDAAICLQPVVVGSERVGWVMVAGKDQLDHVVELAIGQVATTVALFYAEQRAASVARAETLDALLWDLLEGTDAVRRAAIDRAREMRVPLEGPLRLFLCSTDGIERLAAEAGWSTSEVESRRRLVRNTCEQHEEHIGDSRLVGERGSFVAMLYADAGTDKSERGAHKLALRIARHIPGLSVHIGASGMCNNAYALPTAFREAKISLKVAKQRTEAGGAVYDRVGMVGLLLGLREEADMRRLVESTFGRLLREEKRQRQILFDTLRTFFDVNGSQEAAAKRMRVHRKTISYRLTKIAQLTGLDLTTHEDRLLADLVLYIHQQLSSGNDREA